MEKAQPKGRETKPRKLGRLGAAIFSVAALASACNGVLPQTEMPEGLEAAEFTARAIGDSLTAGADGQDVFHPENDQDLLLTELNGRGYAADVQALIGAQTGGLALSLPQPGHETDITVIALGTNDMRGTTETNGEPAVPVATALANVEAYMAAYSDCDVLVGINETSLSWFLHVNALVYNKELEELATQYNGVFVDWAEIVNNHPHYLKSSDEVHLTPEGNEAYRQIIANGADACADKLSQQPEPTTVQP